MTPYLFPNPDYRARCVRVVDGDTADLLVDLGMRCYRKERIRLLAVDAPEKHGPKAEPEKAKAAEDFLRATISVGGPDDWPLMLRGIRKDTDSFGRWLALVFIRTADSLEDTSEKCVNDMLREAGHAKVYKR